MYGKSDIIFGTIVDLLMGWQLTPFETFIQSVSFLHLVFYFTCHPGFVARVHSHFLKWDKTCVLDIALVLLEYIYQCNIAVLRVYFGSYRIMKIYVTIQYFMIAENQKFRILSTIPVQYYMADLDLHPPPPLLPVLAIITVILFYREAHLDKHTFRT